MAACSLQTCTSVLCVFGRMEEEGQEADIRWDSESFQFTVAVRYADSSWRPVRGAQVCPACLAYLAQEVVTLYSVLPGVRVDAKWSLTCTHSDNCVVTDLQRPPKARSGGEA